MPRRPFSTLLSPSLPRRVSAKLFSMLSRGAFAAKSRVERPWFIGWWRRHGGPSQASKDSPLTNMGVQFPPQIKSKYRERSLKGDVCGRYYRAAIPSCGFWSDEFFGKYWFLGISFFGCLVLGVFCPHQIYPPGASNRQAVDDEDVQESLMPRDRCKSSTPSTFSHIESMRRCPLHHCGPPVSRNIPGLGFPLHGTETVMVGPHPGSFCQTA